MEEEIPGKKEQLPHEEEDDKYTASYRGIRISSSCGEIPSGGIFGFLVEQKSMSDYICLGSKRRR